jgi:hypothetical protein
MIQKQIREGIRPYFKATFVVIFMALTCMAGCKDDDEGKGDGDGNESVSDGGKLEVAGKTYLLDTATWAHYSASERALLQISCSNGNVNINLINVRGSEIPIGTFPFDRESTTTALDGVNVVFNDFTASGIGDSKLVIAKSGNRYKITLTGTLKVNGSTLHDYKLTYNGIVQKKN